MKIVATDESNDIKYDKLCHIFHNVLLIILFRTKHDQHQVSVPHVRILDEDNPIHVPMSLRARTSVLDLWLAVESALKVYWIG